MKHALVLYHRVCPDGFGAAWAAWRAFGEKAEYIPVSYGDPFPVRPLLDVYAVYILDFSYPRAELEELHAKLVPGAILRVLDHHKTAQADLAGLPYAIFDMDKSGARLAWEHFHPGSEVPPLIEYVEDRDLWRFKLPASREVAAYVRSWPMDFDTWNALAHEVQHQMEGVRREGAALLRMTREQVAIMAGRGTLRLLGGHRVPVANATVFFSEVGEALCRRFPKAPFAAYYYDTDGKRYWGLRAESGFDCSAVAKQYGGGGHPGAAGFRSEIGWLPERA